MASGDSSGVGRRRHETEMMSKQSRKRTPRYWERRANNQRAAWNRIGAKYGLAREDVDYAKKHELSPYPILRKNASHTPDSVRAYIRNCERTPQQYESMADYLVDREIDRLTEIARLEQEGLDAVEILERVGEHWW